MVVGIAAAGGDLDATEDIIVVIDMVAEPVIVRVIVPVVVKPHAIIFIVTNAIISVIAYRINQEPEHQAAWLENVPRRLQQATVRTMSLVTKMAISIVKLIKVGNNGAREVGSLKAVKRVGLHKNLLKSHHKNHPRSLPAQAG